MSEENVNKVIDSLTVLFNKLGILGDQAFTYLAKYTIVEGISKLILCVIEILIFIWLSKKLKNSWLEANKSENGDATMFYLIVCALLFAITVFVLISCYYDFTSGITQIFTPEGYLIKDILNKL